MLKTLNYQKQRNEAVTVQNEDFIAGLEYAAMLQQAILPKQRHFDRIFSDSFILYKPYQVVSGDFYWLAELGDLVYLAVGDCMGHGVRGAMLSVMAHSLLDYAILNKSIKKTYKILREFDKKFLESFSSSDKAQEYNNDWIDISLCCIDRTKKTIFFSGAKRSIIHVNSNGINHYKGSNYPIGGWQMQRIRPYETLQIPYETGDQLYLYTDGFQDQIGGPKEKKFKFANFKRFIEYLSPYKMNEQCEQLDTFNEYWKGELPVVDDVCIIGVKL